MEIFNNVFGMLLIVLAVCVCVPFYFYIIDKRKNKKYHKYSVEELNQKLEELRAKYDEAVSFNDLIYGTQCQNRIYVIEKVLKEKEAQQATNAV